MARATGSTGVGGGEDGGSEGADAGVRSAIWALNGKKREGRETGDGVRMMGGSRLLAREGEKAGCGSELGRMEQAE